MTGNSIPSILRAVAISAHIGVQGRFSVRVTRSGESVLAWVVGKDRREILRGPCGPETERRIADAQRLYAFILGALRVEAMAEINEAAMLPMESVQ